MQNYNKDVCHWGVTAEYFLGVLSVGYAISAKCFEEKESNKLPYFGKKLLTMNTCK